MGLFIRTVGMARARTKIGLANLVYNVKRLIVLERWAALAPDKKNDAAVSRSHPR
jgi:hypothetical protein